MTKKQNRNKVDHAAVRTAGNEKRGSVLAALAALAYFFVVCVSCGRGSKAAALGLAVGALAAVFLCFERLRDRMGVPLLLLAVFGGLGGISTLYAVSGKFALYEFLKILCAFCLALILLAAAPAGEPGRWIAKVLAGFAALTGLVSVDLMSTRLLSGPVLAVLSDLTGEYVDFAGVEPGVRMTSMFDLPNVFAGVAGIGVLLSLGLAETAESRNEKLVQTVILYVNSLAFLLAFSMGGTAFIALAFVAFLLLERRDRRVELLILMVETLAFVVLAAGVISVTSFRPWDGLRPVPMLCLLLGAAGLCVTDTLLGKRLAKALAKRGRLIPILVAAVLALVAVFALAAYNLTGPASLDAGEGLRRAAYPEPGAYTLAVDSDRPLLVTVESQNQRDTMMHTSSVLYSGEAAGAAFEVPEGSLVVYFNLSAPEGAEVRTVTFTGANGSGSLPLDYRLLPGFMANRLQGLWANENAIQRLVFFADGMKLFRRSPVIGLGLGSFDNAVRSVQSFRYATRYAHNHYIQTLAETGVIGLILFLLVLGVSAAAVLFDRRQGERTHPLTPALGAALVFMAGHAAVEVVFSFYSYLPIAFGVFALISLCCGEAVPKLRLKKRGKTVSLLACAAYIALFTVLLICNMRASYLGAQGRTYSDLAEAVKLDRFEWADYALTYVERAAGEPADSEIRQQADAYARRLGELDSNTAPIHLAAYYFRTGRTEQALAMAEKYVRYLSSDPLAWQETFDLLAQYEDDSEAFRSGVRSIAGVLEDWNKDNLGTIALNESALALIERASES